MKLSARISLVVALAFAVLCLAYGGYAWWQLRAMPEGPTRDDAHGFVVFFILLGAVGIVSAIVSWRMTRDEAARDK